MQTLIEETISLLKSLLPKARELRRRKALYQRIQRLSTHKGAVSAGPSTEALLRDDRER